MTEKELIDKIKELKQIKPREDWVLLTKRRIFGPEKVSQGPISISPIISVISLKWRPAYILTFIITVIVGLTFTFAQSTVPGDFLYPVKKLTETAQVKFSSEIQKPKIYLELANKRLEDLDRIAKQNLVGNLAPTIAEFQANVSEAAKDLVKLEATTSSDPRLMKEIVAQIKKLEKNKKKIEALGIEVGEIEQLDLPLAQLVEREIEDLEKRNLTEDQHKLLEEAKEDFQAGDFAQALEKILLLSYPQP